jgi:hypothetical protein
MNIDDAVSKAKEHKPEAGEVLRLVGRIEEDATPGKLRVYPSLTSSSAYVVIEKASVKGDVLDLTESLRERNPAQQDSVFSVPVEKGTTIEFVTRKTIEITDPATQRNLAADQRPVGRPVAKSGGDCGCGCGGAKQPEATHYATDGGCHQGSCGTVSGETYPCYEGSGEWTFCSGCCVALTPNFR